MTQWHSTNTPSIRAHARVALAVCLLGKSKVQAQWPFLFAPLLRRLCGGCFTGANLALTWARLQNGRAYGSGSINGPVGPETPLPLRPPESGPRRLGGPCRFRCRQRKWPTCSGRDVRFIARPPHSCTGRFPAYSSHLGWVTAKRSLAGKIISSFVHERR